MPLATRAKPLWDSQARLANHRMLGIYMLTIEVLAVCFVFSAGLLLDGFDFTDERRCRGGIYLCLVFYVGAKALLYLFCVERAHLFRGPHVPRLRDWIYVLGMAIVVLGFGTIGILAFMHPVTSISAIDGLCRIGLPLFVTLPLLIYDILLNFMGVAVFYFIMGQSEVGLISWREIWLALTKMLPCAKDDRHPTFRVAFVGVFTKCFIGFVVAIVPTCVNLVILFFVNGHEQAWVCFLMCTIDGKFSIAFVLLLLLLIAYSYIGGFCRPLDLRWRWDDTGSSCTYPCVQPGLFH